MKTSVFYSIEFNGNYVPANYHRYYFNRDEAVAEANIVCDEFVENFCSSHESKVISDFVNDLFSRYFRQIVIRHSDGYCNILTLIVDSKEFLVK